MDAERHQVRKESIINMSRKSNASLSNLQRRILENHAFSGAMADFQSEKAAQEGFASMMALHKSKSIVREYADEMTSVNKSLRKQYNSNNDNKKPVKPQTPRLLT